MSSFDGTVEGMRLAGTMWADHSVMHCVYVDDYGVALEDNNGSVEMFGTVNAAMFALSRKHEYVDYRPYF